MEITDIIKDSFKYPFSDKKQFALIFLVFVVLGLLLGLSLASPVIFGGLKASGSTVLIMAIVFFIISLIVTIFICGYQIDIIKVACNLEDEFPSFDPVENIKSGLKLIVVYLVFYIIMAIVLTIGMLLSFGFLSTGEIVGYSMAIIIYLIFLIVAILISWVWSMSLCRLAYHGSIGEALDLKQAYQDLRTVGLADMLIYVLVLGIIIALIVIVAMIIVVVLLSAIDYAVTGILAVLILFALGSYLFIVQSRSIGLLYSKVIHD